MIAPHGGELRQLLVGSARARELKEESLHLPAWDLTPKQVCDLELLVSGAFSPLGGFLGIEDYEGVCGEMRLARGTLWPMPIVLDVSEEFASGVEPGARVALRHEEGLLLAVLTVADLWRPDLREEARRVFETKDPTHPGVFQLLHRTNPVYLGGPLEAVQSPPHHTYRHLRRTPAEVRAIFAERGWNRVVAFQTRNPLHRAHVELTRRAAAQAEARLLIHPVVGRTRPGDVDYFSRVRCYEAVLAHYPADSTLLSLLPLAMRMGGPREALWHAIIRKNFGCTHFIVGRDHAGPGSGSDRRPFYAPYGAQDLIRRHQDEIGIRMVPFEEFVFVEEENRFVPRSEVPSGRTVLQLSGTELRRRLDDGGHVPEWFTYPEVLHELRRTRPPRGEKGFTVFFTGLSGAGKSTIAQVLTAKLMETGGRPVTLLDGDVVRKHLSSDLGFSREHRDINVRRIGFVASEITKNGGVAVCAPIAPYDATRREVRDMVCEHGGFILVHVSTPLDVCEQRDRKGLYAKARAGLLKGFTGIDDPYEPPGDAEIAIDSTALTPEEAAGRILLHLRNERYLA